MKSISKADFEKINNNFNTYQSMFLKKLSADLITPQKITQQINTQLKKQQKRRRLSSGHIYNFKDRMTLSRYSFGLQKPLYQSLKTSGESSEINKLDRKISTSESLLRTKKRNFERHIPMTKSIKLPQEQQQIQKLIQIKRNISIPKVKPQILTQSKKNLISKKFKLDRHPALLKQIVLKLQML